MNLTDLKTREKELRRKYGDDFYEKMYMHYSARTAAAPAAVMAAGTEGTVLPSAQRTAVVSAPKSIEEFRKGIEDINRSIDSLNRQQYQHMLAGNDNRVMALDSVIKNAERQRETLKKQMSLAMGLRREGESTYRSVNKPVQKSGVPYSGSPGNGHFSTETPQVQEDKEISDGDLNDLGYGNSRTDGGQILKPTLLVSDDDIAIWMKPEPSPMAGAPPVDAEDHDMKLYNDVVNGFYDNYDAWRVRTGDLYGLIDTVDPDYLKNKKYISRDQYFKKMYEIYENKGLFEAPSYNEKKDILYAMRLWSRVQEICNTPQKLNIDYIDRKNYATDKDYYDEVAKHVISYTDNYDPEGLKKFYEKNGINDDETKWKIKISVNKQREEMKLRHNMSAATSDSKPINGDVESYEKYWNKEPISGDCGQVYVRGEAIDIIPWSYENSDHQHEAIESYHFEGGELNVTRFNLNLNLEEEAPLVVVIADFINQLNKASDWFTVDVDIVNINGQKKAIIKYNDSAWSNLAKESGKEIYDPNHETAVNLIKEHNEDEFGYIIVKNGKTWLKPLVYPGDRFFKLLDDDWKDVTYQLEEPIHIPTEFAEEINKKFLEQGLGIELP